MDERSNPGDDALNHLDSLQLALRKLIRENEELRHTVERLQTKNDAGQVTTPRTPGPSSSKLLLIPPDSKEADDSVRLSLKLTWSQLGMEHAPSGRCWSSATVLNDHVIIQGGYSGSNSYYNDIYYFDPCAPQRAWQLLKVTGNPPPPLYAHTLDAVPSCGSLVLCGGGTGRNYQNDVFILSDIDLISGTGRWENVTEMFPELELWARRGAHATSVVGDKLYLFGGDNGHGTYFDDMYEFDVRAMKFKLLDVKGKPPPKRGWHSMCTIGNTLYVYGGTDGSQTYRDLHMFDTLTNTWRQPATGGRPASPRYSHSAVVVGSEMLIFGGSYESGSHNDAFIFDAESLCWLHPTLEGDAPSERYGHVSVLARDRVFVFGGYSGSSFTRELYVLPLEKNSKHVSKLSQQVINALMTDLRRMVNDEEYADVIFEVEGRHLYAHRNLLAQRCQHFARMFRSGMKESLSDQKIILLEISYSVFLSVLQFIYSGYCNIDQTSAQDLLIAADRFGINELKSLCESWLLKRVNINNVLSMVLIADRYNAMQLRDNCLRFINKNRELLMADEEVTKHPELQVIFVETGSLSEAM